MKAIAAIRSILVRYVSSVSAGRGLGFAGMMFGAGLIVFGLFGVQAPIADNLVIMGIAVASIGVAAFLFPNTRRSKIRAVYRLMVRGFLSADDSEAAIRRILGGAADDIPDLALHPRARAAIEHLSQIEGASAVQAMEALRGVATSDARIKAIPQLTGVFVFRATPDLRIVFSHENGGVIVLDIVPREKIIRLAEHSGLVG